MTAAVSLGSVVGCTELPSATPEAIAAAIQAAANSGCGECETGEGSCTPVQNCAGTCSGGEVTGTIEGTSSTYTWSCDRHWQNPDNLDQTYACECHATQLASGIVCDCRIELQPIN